MQKLIDRLQNATGPDRKLDAAIHTEAVGLDDYWSIHDRSDGSLCLRYYPGPPGPEYHPLPRYTASIDAALPGETIVSMVRLGDGHPWKATAIDANGTQYGGESAVSEAIARRIAALRASAPLLAKETR